MLVSGKENGMGAGERMEALLYYFIIFLNIKIINNKEIYYKMHSSGGSMRSMCKGKQSKANRVR